MRILKLASASVVAVALAVSLGSVSAYAESSKKDVKATPKASSEAKPASTQFATLAGVKATPMSSKELDAVKGQHVHFLDANGGFHLAGNPAKQTNNWENLGGSDGAPVAPSYHGLCVAAGFSGPGGGISIPGGQFECPLN